METLLKITKDATDKLKLTNLKEIYRGHYYTKSNVRNVIFACTYKNETAILKVYNDPRETFEPSGLKAFHKNNKSKIITAPKLFAHQEINKNQGWLLIEKLPPGKFFAEPMSETEREEFMTIFLEYRKNFPTKPTRELSLIENLPANQFHLFRLNKWLNLASENFDEKIIEQKKILSLFTEISTIINQEFTNRKKIWCHGHFKNKEVYKAQNKKIYLIDFAHNNYYPEGYELAFIPWADYIMSDNFKLPNKQWEKGFTEWQNLLSFYAKKLKYKNPEKLIIASLLERIIGSILADILASDKTPTEKKSRLNKLIPTAKKLIKNYQNL